MLAFGLVEPKTGTQTLKQSMQLINRSNQMQKVQMRVSLDQGKARIKVIMGKSIQISPHAQVNVPVSLSIDTNRLPKGIYTGKILLQTGKSHCEIPIIVLLDPEGYTIINGFYFTEWAISPNGDHKQDDVITSYYLSVPVDQMIIRAENYWIGKTYTIYKGKGLPAGGTEWVWNGKDIHGKLVPDGSYGMLVTVTHNQKKEQLFDSINVDVTPPKIQFDKPASPPALKGIVSDLDIKTLKWKLVGEKKWKNLEFDYIDGNADRVSFNYHFKKEELKQGKNQILLKAEDTAANQTTKSLEIVVPY